MKIKEIIVLLNSSYLKIKKKKKKKKKKDLEHILEQT